MANTDRPSPWRSRLLIGTGLLMLCVVSGAIGGAATRHFTSSNFAMTYTDFLSVMLSALSLLITVLAVFLALMGVIGWTAIEQKVHSKTEEYLTKGFELDGPLTRIVTKKVESTLRRRTNEIMYEGISPLGSDDIAPAAGTDDKQP